MLQLHEDPNFHYEGVRALGCTRYAGSDVSEILEILPKIKPGDLVGWHTEWYNLANRILSTIDEPKIDSYSPVTLRNIYFRASHYFFVADFFMHHNYTDPRVAEAYELWEKYFDKANSLLDIPGIRATVKTPHGFEMPIIVYRAAGASAEKPRPTLLVGGGFDSNMQETYHVYAAPALEQNYNVILYEGPGHPTLLQKQNKGFIHDWEKAVTPIIDHIFAESKDKLAFVDTSKIGLVGMSMGGYLAARAAAFEPRLAALICCDGVHDMMGAAYSLMPDTKEPWLKGDKVAHKKAFESTDSHSLTGRRWFYDDLKYTFQLEDPWAIYEELDKMTLEGGIAEKIKMPALIMDAEQDLFFEGQPPVVAKKIGSNATLVDMGPDQAAQLHCQSGSFTYLNQVLLEWFASVVGH